MHRALFVVLTACTASLESPKSDNGADFSGTCIPVTRDTTTDWTIETTDGLRSVRIFIPADVQAALVIDLHGQYSTASQQDEVSRLAAKGRASRFAVATPSGVDDSWNAGGTCCEPASANQVDDVSFIRAIIERAVTSHCIDPDRVFVTGVSNGGYLAHRLACEASDVIAAIAPVAASMSLPSCTPSRPVPVLMFHGTDDWFVPYDGTDTEPSAPTLAESWAERNGCSQTPVTTLSRGDTTCVARCDVTLCTVDGGGHTWPGGPDLALLGATSHDIDATDEMWRFFSDHAR